MIRSDCEEVIGGWRYILVLGNTIITIIISKL